ncbi:hypothetical protein MATL_G00032590 [Megalops atlanticus]|uniref:Uncharacterized protein n=1 Tax=Megalops atlanticus TaxID=7932 RepID=A0A9D3QD68_MEGAT|nr:hypothetical protein MATL_G00032590 [Megalops atlanticus]
MSSIGRAPAPSLTRAPVSHSTLRCSCARSKRQRQLALRAESPAGTGRGDSRRETQSEVCIKRFLGAFRDAYLSRATREGEPRPQRAGEEGPSSVVWDQSTMEVWDETVEVQKQEVKRMKKTREQIFLSRGCSHRIHH